MIDTYKKFIELMEERAWEADDSPSPLRLMADIYKEMRTSPPWGTVEATPEWADKEVIPLVNAMNSMPGIVTVDSCCGHGEKPFNIYFYAESGPAVRPLFDLVSSRGKWRIIFEPFKGEGEKSYMFQIEGPIGEGAFREADELASEIYQLNRETGD